MKNYLLTLLLLFLTSMLFAQSKFQVGIKGGFGYSNFTETNDDTKGTIGYLIGVQSNLQLNENASLGFEAYYNRHGSKNEEDFLYLNYINVPVLVRFFPSEGFNLHVGPEISFLTSSEVNSMNAEGFFKNTNFSMGAGMGYKMKSGFNIDARYNFGLTSVTPLSTTKTGYGAISIGYFF
ncbi:MAG: porin family protein [Pedobacter sp.]|nr:MAG: porin family protein [Pedobacter sp.]